MKHKAVTALVLLATAAAVSLTGILSAAEWLWGYAWLSDLHGALAWLMTALVIGHWAGIALTSWRQREHLVAAMCTGRKRPAKRTEIT